MFLSLFASNLGGKKLNRVFISTICITIPKLSDLNPPLFYYISQFRIRNSGRTWLGDFSPPSRTTGAAWGYSGDSWTRGYRPRALGLTRRLGLAGPSPHLLSPCGFWPYYTVIPALVTSQTPQKFFWPSLRSPRTSLLPYSVAQTSHQDQPRLKAGRKQTLPLKETCSHLLIYYSKALKSPSYTSILLYPFYCLLC